MPAPAKGARLWLRPERRDACGRVSHHATWIIRDGAKQHRTGCTAGEIERAEAALSEYIRSKHAPVRRELDIERIDIADVLSIYDADARDRQSNHRVFDASLERLTLWWGGRMLSEVTGKTCRAYADHRRAEYLRRHAESKSKLDPRPTGGVGGACRDLEVLRAAINHHAKEGYHRGIVRVALPQRGMPRDRWLTRSEAARLLLACWRTKEEQRLHRGVRTGEVVATQRRPLRHIARFILIGLYTGTRAAAIASASATRGEGRSFIDLERGVFYRLAQGARATKKRQTPVPLPGRLLAHLRRWAEIDPPGSHFVEWNGKPVASVKTGFARGVAKAGLEGKVTPHTLRHTAATWLMQNGTDVWQAAGYLGMSPEMVEKTYGHHHPDYMAEARDAIAKPRTKQVRKPTATASPQDDREQSVISRRERG